MEQCHFVALENDCSAVVEALQDFDGVPPPKLRHAYERHYRAAIVRLSNEMLWVGIRWVPRAESQGQRQGQGQIGDRSVVVRRRPLLDA